MFQLTTFSNDIFNANYVKMTKYIFHTRLALDKIYMTQYNNVTV